MENPGKKSEESSTEKQKVKKGIESYAKRLRENLKLYAKSGERAREYVRDMAKDVQNFSMGFLPEETQKHVTNLEKEALLILKSVIDEGMDFLEK
ncbi:hypothetical protein KY339_05295 [Candidatus Woesearchaeota archaeon]|nr:hypothetical protein [Candidatus Woesearchaeota archaeon]